MRNFKLTVEYDGVGFSGWQKQNKGERTVQGAFEVVAESIFKHPVKVIASGRTDSGVHAAGQVVSFKANTRMTSQAIVKAFNSLLPEDLVVLQSKEVPSDFHAQYSVKDKTYRYTILNSPLRSAFLRHKVYFYPHALNVSLMRKAAKLLVGRHDFKAFQAFDPLRADQGTVRTVKNLIIRQNKEIIQIDITADGFLYKMVRNITGALMAVGSKSISVDDLKNILKSKDRTKAPKTAPAHGLCLMKVRY